MGKSQRTWLLRSLSVLGPGELAATTGDMCHNFCMLLAQPASWILLSVVDLVRLCLSVEGLLLTCHYQSLGIRSDVVFIDLLIRVGHVCNFWHTFVPSLPGCSSIWLFPGNLWDTFIQPSVGHYLLSCWHRTWGSALLGAQHVRCCTDLLFPPSCWCIV